MSRKGTGHRPEAGRRGRQCRGRRTGTGERWGRRESLKNINFNQFDIKTCNPAYHVGLQSRASETNNSSRKGKKLGEVADCGKSPNEKT